jgi:hypothetical protein
MMAKEVQVEKIIRFFAHFLTSAVAGKSMKIDDDDILHSIRAFLSPERKSFDTEWDDYDEYKLVYEYDGYYVYKTKYDPRGEEVYSKRLLNKPEILRYYRILKEILIGFGIDENKVDEYLLDPDMEYNLGLRLYIRFIYHYGDRLRDIAEIGRLYYEALQTPGISGISEIRVNDGRLLVDRPDVLKKLLKKLTKSRIEHEVLPRFRIESLNRDAKFEGGVYIIVDITLSDIKFTAVADFDLIDSRTGIKSENFVDVSFSHTVSIDEFLSKDIVEMEKKVRLYRLGDRDCDGIDYDFKEMMKERNVEWVEFFLCPYGYEGRKCMYTRTHHNLMLPEELISPKYVRYIKAGQYVFECATFVNLNRVEQRKKSGKAKQVSIKGLPGEIKYTILEKEDIIPPRQISVKIKVFIKSGDK